MTDRQAVRGLGWLSIALGLAEVLAPDWLGERLGVAPEHRPIIRAMGMREIATGLGILAMDDPAPALWARVAGDAADLALLATAARRTSRPRSLAAAVAMVAGVTAVDVVFAQRLRRESHDPSTTLAA